MHEDALPGVFRFSIERRKSIMDVDAYCDVVDGDNLQMCAIVLHAFPYAHVNIILSPRPLDLQSPVYGDALSYLKEKVGLPKLIIPLAMQKDQTWLKEIRQNYPQFCHADKGFEEDRIREITPTYLTGSCYRFAEKFTLLGVDPRRYTFYWDRNSMNTIKVGIRHPMHVSDFSYSFIDVNKDDPKDERNEITRFKKAYRLEGPEREEEMLAIMDQAIERQFKELRHPSLKDAPSILHNFDELIETRKANRKVPFAVVGGPFETILRYISILPVWQVWCQALYIAGDRNIFANQFNVHLDVAAAIRFFDIVTGKQVPTLVTPTEAAKGSIFELDDVQLSEAFKYAPWFHEDTKRFQEEAQTRVNTALFDAVAVVGLLCPDILPAKPVKVVTRWKDHETQGKIVLVEAKPLEEGSCLYMSQEDTRHQEQMLPELTELLQEVFRPHRTVG